MYCTSRVDDGLAAISAFPLASLPSAFPEPAVPFFLAAALDILGLAAALGVVGLRTLDRRPSCSGGDRRGDGEIAASMKNVLVDVMCTASTIL